MNKTIFTQTFLLYLLSYSVLANSPLVSKNYFVTILGTNKNDFGQTIDFSKDGGYLISGVSRGLDESKGDALLVKLDSRGKLMYANSIGGIEKEERKGDFIHETKDGGSIVLGSSNIEK